MNYIVKEYVVDIVYIVQEVCKVCEVFELVIVLELGWVFIVYYVVLILLVVDVIGLMCNFEDQELMVLGEDSYQIVCDMYEMLENIFMCNYWEFYNDVVGDKQMLYNFFDFGYVIFEDWV